MVDRERKIEALDNVLMLIEWSVEAGGRQEDISEDDLEFQHTLIANLRDAYRDGRLL